MELKERAIAGTLDSSDVYIIVEPNDKKENVIEIKSTVLDQFERDIRRVVLETLEQMHITNAIVKIEDKGALDVVIKSRLQTAITRSSKTNKYIWE